MKEEKWIRLRAVSLLVCSGFLLFVFLQGFLGWVSVLLVPNLEANLELVWGMSDNPVVLGGCMLVTIFFIPVAAFLAAFKVVKFLLWDGKGWQPERDYLEQLLENRFRRKLK